MKLRTLIIICIIGISTFGCSNKLSDKDAINLVRKAFELDNKVSLEILGISYESKDVALAKANLDNTKYLFKIRFYDKGWQLDEIQNEFGSWMPAELIINRYNKQKTEEEIEYLGSAIAKIIRDSKGFRRPEKISILVPKYINAIPLHDKWGTEYRIKIKNIEPVTINQNLELSLLGVDEYFIISAGEDKKFFTDDDIIWNFHGYWRFEDFKDYLK